MIGVEATVEISIYPDRGPGNFAHFYNWAKNGAAPKGASPHTYHVAPNVNGNPAVWAQGVGLLTKVGGDQLLVNVLSYNEDMVPVSTNERYAEQLASLVEVNSFTPR
jgi:hypothetical protein